MKKLTVALSAVAVSVMMAGMADAAEIYNKDGNKLDLYGKVDGLHYFSKDKGDDGDQSYVRFGFKGETQINDQLTGYGQWEYNIQANNDEDNGTKGNATRLAFAGLKFANFGSIDYGRNNGVIYDIGAWTDVLPEFGNDTYEDADRFMTGRASGLLTYHNTDFFGLVNGLNFNLQYQGKNGGLKESNNGREDAKNQNGDGYGMSVTWEGDDGFGVGTAYSSSHRVKGQRADDAPGNADGKRAEVWTAGLKYDANNIYLAATYAQTRNMQWVDIGNGSKLYTAAVCGNVTPDEDDCGLFTHRTDNVEIVAQYMFDFGLQPSIAYLQSKAKGTDKYGSFDLVKYVDVGATYNFNKNMSAYVDYKINLLKDNNPAGLSTENIVATGLVYEF
ncbi:porin OmpC [Salmonella enterica subsp. enterica serovar Newport]|nr:phosphoporin PhoE [Salmonella enterica subsp. enterica serovar Newport]HAF2409576.1 porin OmpC [Salmonella enterica]HCL0956461.1 porin OmpC [Salmonella enterica subsp. enterica serovar Muenchen]EBV5495451.1 phosphoporin PhoE [Salmonella enterica subsp. enterica serovar Newport]ECD4560150.1 porin OmpC [Salmonella enterica subsp. enterica serovar Newport]